MSTAAASYGTAVSRHRSAASYVDIAQALLAGTGDLRLQQLMAQLADQRTRLSALAFQLQLPAPWLAGQQLNQVGIDSISGDQALDQASNSLLQAEASIREIQQQLSAPLLPKATPAVRAGLVYGAWSLVGWLVQCGLLVASNGTSPSALLTSLCAMPVLAFGGGVLTLHLFGQPREGAKANYFFKLGIGFCLLAMPLAWIALIGGLALLRG